MSETEIKTEVPTCNGIDDQPTHSVSVASATWWCIRYMVIPLFVGRERSILALDRAMDQRQTHYSGDLKEVLPISMIPRRRRSCIDVGTLATVLQLLKLPDGTTKVLVEGGERVRRSTRYQQDKVTISRHRLGTGSRRGGSTRLNANSK